MTSNLVILVTGGAGYIGSHTAHQLVDAGHKVVVVDNLYSGHRWAVPEQGEFYEGDAGNRELVNRIISEHGVQAVVHFAGHIVVPESVKDPLKYYRNNPVVSANLIESCLNHDVRHFVFSSSAAVYGIPSASQAREDTQTAPINPYGRSKLITEWTLRDVAESIKLKSQTAASHTDFRYVALRYFNVAGAHDGGLLGQATPEATHLIKVASEAACGARESITVFGTDYPTPDGTCIRDYIHVEDLAAAHLSALSYLFEGGESEVLNCGYGHGYSVREVISAVKAASNIDFSVVDGNRRAGDPPELVADNSKIQKILGWRPQRDDLELICQSAYNWEKRYQSMSEEKVA